MIKINWNNDKRNQDSAKYLVGPRDPESRRKAFLSGWTKFLNEEKTESLNGVTGVGLGMAYASILGDIEVDKRKQLYTLLLDQYLTTDRTQEWTQDQKEEALRLATED